MPSVYHQRFSLVGWQDHLSREDKLLNGLRLSRELSSKLVLFFLPLFLFQLGESLPLVWPLHNAFQQGMVLIAAYYLLSRCLMVLFIMPIGNVIAQIGPQRAFLVGQIGHAVYFISLLAAAKWPVLIFLAIIGEASQAFFWNAYYTVLSQNALKRQMGSRMCSVSFIVNLTAMLAPIIGGVVVVRFGYPLLFLFGLVWVLVGMICSILMQVTPLTDRVSWAEFLSWLREPGYRKLAVSYAGRYVNDAILVVWPLYVFFVLGTADRVGFIYGLSLFLAMIVNYFLGAVLDHQRNRQPFLISGGILSVIWLVRSWLVGFWSIALVDMVERLTANFHWIFFDMLFMRRGKGNQALSFFVYRELVISGVAMLFWALFAAVFIVTTEPWQLLFVLGSVGVMLSLLVKDRKDPIHDQI